MLQCVTAPAAWLGDGLCTSRAIWWLGGRRYEPLPRYGVRYGQLLVRRAAAGKLPRFVGASAPGVARCTTALDPNPGPHRGPFSLVASACGLGADGFSRCGRAASLPALVRASALGYCWWSPVQGVGLERIRSFH